MRKKCHSIVTTFNTSVYSLNYQRLSLGGANIDLRGKNT